ncbi:MAG TPA: hypothetical protein VFT74_15985, partial [Isosphaeraceae bacterium]|nr:hypothetical protein [Isosphaeraceae bacterium]
PQVSAQDLTQVASSGLVSTSSIPLTVSSRHRGRLALRLARREARSHHPLTQPSRTLSDSSGFALLLARRQQRLLRWQGRHTP